MLTNAKGSTNDDDPDLKRLRTTRDEPTPSQLPTPLTRNDSTDARSFRHGTETPPEGRPSQIQPSQHALGGFSQLDSPPIDTQPFSQLPRVQGALSDQVEDEDREGVWGYLIPLDSRFGETLVLRRRAACPAPKRGSDFGQGSARKAKAMVKYQSEFVDEENAFEDRKAISEESPSGGYLVGRHRECGMSLPRLLATWRPC